MGHILHGDRQLEVSMDCFCAEILRPCLPHLSLGWVTGYGWLVG